MGSVWVPVQRCRPPLGIGGRAELGGIGCRARNRAERSPLEVDPSAYWVVLACLVFLVCPVSLACPELVLESALVSVPESALESAMELESG